MSAFVLDASVAMRWCFDSGIHEYADNVLTQLATGAASAAPPSGTCCSRSARKTCTYPAPQTPAGMRKSPARANGFSRAMSRDLKQFAVDTSPLMTLAAAQSLDYLLYIDADLVIRNAVLQRGHSGRRSPGRAGHRRLGKNTSRTNRNRPHQSLRTVRSCPTVST